MSWQFYEVLAFVCFIPRDLYDGGLHFSYTYLYQAFCYEDCSRMITYLLPVAGYVG